MERTPDIRILLADASAATRLGLAGALREAALTIVAQAEDADEAVQRALETRPDVCLVDVALPGGGITAAGRLAAELDGCRLVVLTDRRSDDELLQAVRAGAVGYVSKDIEPSRLPAVVRGVVAGETALPRALLGRLLDEVRSRGMPSSVTLADGRSVSLTRREQTMADALRSGAGTREIADALGVSEVTVRRHISTLLAKLEVPDRQSAAALLRELDGVA